MAIQTSYDENGNISLIYRISNSILRKRLLANLNIEVPGLEILDTRDIYPKYEFGALCPGVGNGTQIVDEVYIVADQILNTELE